MVVSASACDPYTYFNVNVKIQESGDNAVADPNTVMQFAGCDVSVYANDGATPIETGIPLIQRTLGSRVGACRGLETPRPSLGILDYSTARSSGVLKFKVNIYDAPTPPHNIIVQGYSENMAVSPGHVLPTLDLVASPCLDPNNPDRSTTNQPKEGACTY
jgi:hypothetical protein